MLNTELAITAIISYAAAVVMASLATPRMDKYSSRAWSLSQDLSGSHVESPKLHLASKRSARPLVSQYFVDFLFGRITTSKIIIDMDIA